MSLSYVIQGIVADTLTGALNLWEAIKDSPKANQI